MTTNDFRGLYDIRDFSPADRNFVLATFLRGLYYGDSWFSLIPKQIFFDNYKKVAAVIIDNSSTVIRVACLPDDRDVILGYSILSQDQSIHWVYVKSIWRNKGIATSLLPDSPIRITHLSTLGKYLMNKLPNCVFNPFL